MYHIPLPPGFETDAAAPAAATASSAAAPITVTLTRTARPSLVSRDLVNSLIVQHLLACGMQTAAKVFQEEAKFTYTGAPASKPGDPSRLHALMLAAVSDMDRLFDPADARTAGDDVDAEELSQVVGATATDDDAVEVEDTNIWDDEEDRPENIVWSKRTTTDSKMESLEFLKAASLNKLVERLTSENTKDTAAQLKYQKTFLMTYRSFTDPMRIIAKLRQRYDVPPDPSLSEAEWQKKRCAPIQLRVCNVLKTWVETYFFDFNDAAIRKLEDFIDNVIARNNPKMAKTLRTLVTKKIEGRSVKLEQSFATPPPEPRVPMAVFTPSELSLFDIDALEIARQLTLLDSRSYQAIQPSELLNLAWSKPKLRHRAANIIAMTERFNRMSGWVSTCILKETKLKSRARMMAKMVQIAEAFYQLNNFNGLMAVVSGLRASAVSRLKFTVEEMPQKIRDVQAELEELMQTQSSFKRYRQHLHSVNPPCIPFLGIYLTDLTFIEDGNKDMLGNLINFFKRRLIYDVILEVQQYQQQGYNLLDVPQLQEWILNAEVFPPTSFHEISLRLEPRGADRSDIA